MRLVRPSFYETRTVKRGQSFVVQHLRPAFGILPFFKVWADVNMKCDLLASFAAREYYYTYGKHYTKTSNQDKDFAWCVISAYWRLISISHTNEIVRAAVKKL